MGGVHGSFILLYNNIGGPVDFLEDPVNYKPNILWVENCKGNPCYCTNNMISHAEIGFENTYNFGFERHWDILLLQFIKIDGFEEGVLPDLILDTQPC